MIKNGRKRILRGYRKNRSDWAVLLVDHHEGYLSWPDYERNQRLIADNANGKGMMVRGAVRKGEALLTGLLRCGHCGRRLLVSYNGTKGDVGRYICDATRSNPGADPCISFGALRVDEAVGAEIVRLLLSRNGDTQPKTRAGETVSDWAAKFNDPAVIQALNGTTKTAPVNPPQSSAQPPDARTAVQRSVSLLERATKSASTVPWQ